MLRTILIATAMLLCAASPGMTANNHAPQSALNPAKAAESKKYPTIVLYSTSWCPHCREAKEYMTSHNIPFINRDVEVDSSAYDLLTKKYESQGVPVIVMGEGKNEVVIRGFTPEIFQEKLKKFIPGT